MSSVEPRDVITRFADAYNAGDDDTMLSLCSPDIHVTHHNRGLDIQGKEAFAGVLSGFQAAFPDKHFENRRAMHVDGDNVIVEHTWTGTAVADVPGFAQNGEKAELDLCSRYTVRDGLIVEYHDYG